MNELLLLPARRRHGRRHAPPLRLVPLRLVPLLLVPWLLVLALTTATRRASADACSSCPAPSGADFEAALGRPLGDLPTGAYMEILAAECAYDQTGGSAPVQGPAWIVLRGTGEVWNCPDSSSEDTVSIEVAESDNTSWTLTSEVSAKVAALAMEAAVKVGVGVGGGHSVTEIKRVTKTLTASLGHRIPWEGYFTVADFTLTLEFAVSRRWSWWVKSSASGDTVLTSGSLYSSCGRERATLKRRAAIGYKFQLGDGPCGPGLALPTDLGPWPAPIPPPPPPTTPDSGSLPAPQGATPPTPAGPPPVTLDDPDEDDPAGQPAPPGPSVPPLPPLPLPAPSPTDPTPGDSGALGDAPTGRLYAPSAEGVSLVDVAALLAALS